MPLADLQALWSCGICGHMLPAKAFYRPDGSREATCKRCGEYRFDSYFLRNPPTIPTEDRPYLSAATRQASERGEGITISVGYWQKLVDSHRNTTEHECQNLILAYVEKRTIPSGSIDLTTLYDYPLFDMESREVLEFKLEQLKDEGLLEVERLESPDPKKTRVKLSPNGRSRIARPPQVTKEDI